MNIISQLPTLYQELEQNFETVFKAALAQKAVYGYEEFRKLFSEIIHPLLKLGFFKNAKVVKYDSVGTYSDFTWIQMYKFEGERPYFVIVATYVGSCYGCLGRYACNCDKDDCECERKTPKTVKSYVEALEYFKSRFLDCFKDIVAKSTVIENEAEALEMFSEISKKVYGEEQVLKYA